MFFPHKIEDCGVLGKVHATQMRMFSICFFMDTTSSCAHFFKMT